MLLSAWLGWFKCSDIVVGLTELAVGFFYGGFGGFSLVVDCLCFTGLLRFCLCWCCLVVLFRGLRLRLFI